MSSTQDESSKDFLKNEIVIKCIEAMPALLPLFKELDFTVDIELDGELKKEGFEPKMHVKIKVGRDSTKSLNFEKLKLDKQNTQDYIQAIEQLMEKYTGAFQGSKPTTPFTSTVSYAAQIPATTTYNASTTYNWNEISSTDDSKKDGASTSTSSPKE